MGLASKQGFLDSFFAFNYGCDVSGCLSSCLDFHITMDCNTVNSISSSFSYVAFCHHNRSKIGTGMMGGESREGGVEQFLP